MAKEDEAGNVRIIFARLWSIGRCHARLYDFHVALLILFTHEARHKDFSRKMNTDIAIEAFLKSSIAHLEETPIKTLFPMSYTRAFTMC